MNVLIQRCLLSLLLLAPLAAQAQDGNAALYGPVAPAGSAYVRVLNLSGAPAEVLLSGKASAQKVNAGQLGAYVFIAPGNRKITVNQTSQDANLQGNSAYTLVYDGSSLQSIVDPYSDDPKKALVAFYNLTDQPLALKTQDGKHAIVDNVAKNHSGVRPVNEIKIGFAAFNGEQSVARFDEQFLKKGRSYSYLVIPDGGSYRAISQANSLDAIE
ncbi:alginate O-acetyltransferase AlgF [Zestomonas carbonaria]|uniref:Alginate biosynthesis protein AlgF n=1 Tax=Zestomonas carbonaria TaxID=2762745 RepID=A0A7U7I8G8_9GAMM|nr:alginate O-acetyltransferase AlgF [Pseudomonas carbonaria]CAD5107304.1 Alginate biosynthesis protein AlgF [Pseudomonas carbonaria]